MHLYNRLNDYFASVMNKMESSRQAGGQIKFKIDVENLCHKLDNYFNI